MKDDCNLVLAELPVYISNSPDKAKLLLDQIERIAAKNYQSDPLLEVIKGHIQLNKGDLLTKVKTIENVMNNIVKPNAGNSLKIESNIVKDKTLQYLPEVHIAYANLHRTLAFNDQSGNSNNSYFYIKKAEKHYQIAVGLLNPDNPEHKQAFNYFKDNMGEYSSNQKLLKLVARLNGETVEEEITELPDLFKEDKKEKEKEESWVDTVKPKMEEPKNKEKPKIEKKKETPKKEQPKKEEKKPKGKVKYKKIYCSQSPFDVCLDMDLKQYYDDSIDKCMDDISQWHETDCE
ncbi:hypothetical protein ACFL1H_07310 [Nanoarchaeota archaeon]